jgi:hypothetical protein
MDFHITYIDCLCMIICNYNIYVEREKANKSGMTTGSRRVLQIMHARKSMHHLVIAHTYTHKSSSAFPITTIVRVQTQMNTLLYAFVCAMGILILSILVFFSIIIVIVVYYYCYYYYNYNWPPSYYDDGDAARRATNNEPL